MIAVEEKICKKCGKEFSTYNEEIIFCGNCRVRKKSDRFKEDKRRRVKKKVRKYTRGCKGCQGIFNTVDKRRVYCEDCRTGRKFGYKRNCKNCQKEFTTSNKNFFYCENCRKHRRGKLRKIKNEEKQQIAFHLSANYNVSYYEAIEIVEELSGRKNLIEFIGRDKKIIEENLIGFIEENNVIKRELKKCF